MASSIIRTEGDGMENSEEKAKLVEKKLTILSEKSQKPKFVPLEPYKAAIRSVKADEEQIRRFFVSKAIQTVEKSDCENCQLWLTEKITLEKQLREQVNVNADLKKMLMAALGEDLEMKVNVLTKDRLHLTEELIVSSKKLSTHQQQVEWLAGQCEVWQSKFAASSVMVKELTECKDALVKRLQETYDTLENLLDERKRLRKDLIGLYENLSVLKASYDFLTKRSPLQTSNNLDLAHECHLISNGLVGQLLGANKRPHLNFDESSQLTASEKTADKLLVTRDCVHLLGKNTEAVCSAVIGAGQLTLSPKIECCRNCSGQIHFV